MPRFPFGPALLLLLPPLLVAQESIQRPAAIPSTSGRAPTIAETEPILRAIPVDPANLSSEGGLDGAALVEPAEPAAPPPLTEASKKTPTEADGAEEESDEAPKPAGPPTGDDAIRLQIFLDQSKFGPGVIDGKAGLFTKLAVQSWNEVNGHPVEDWEAVMGAARKAVPVPLATAIVPDVSKEWIDPSLPTKRSLQAKRKRMSYRSTVEFMAERYHTDTTFLTTLNGSPVINKLAPRATLIVPNVEPFRIESLTGARYEADEALSARHVVVNTKINQVRIFEAAPAALVVTDPENPPPVRPNRALVASFPITPGQPKFIHYGTWEMKNCLEFPYWRYDQSLLDTGKRSKDALNIPAGPNSPVGILWAGLSRPGIGLHGTADPETIGRARSAGCIRLANWDAIRLPTLVRPGATVEIR